MSRNQNGMSRHEELRYNYLLKNLEYLSPREKQEFDYLYRKKQFNQPTSVSNQSGDYEEFYDDYSDYNDWEGDDYTYFDDQYTSQGLPKYPEEIKQKQSKSRSTKQAAAFYQTDLPVYADEIIDESTVEVTPEPRVKKRQKKKKPRRKGRMKRFFRFVLLLLLATLAGMVFMYFKGAHDVTSGKTDYSPAVKEVFHGKDTTDGTNILILGSDQRITQGSSDARTDTIMVANVGNSDGKVKLVSFMRDTLVNIEGVSYNSYTNDQKLNVAFNIGEQNNNQGAELMRETLKDNFDLDIKYYVMIDFETFGEAIDTLFPKGVKINAKFNTVNGEKVESVEAPNDIGFGDQSTPYQTIHVGEQRMNGQTLLNYARFRSDDNGDYGRTERQQQVISAIISQIKDPTKLFTGSSAIGKVFTMTSTNISFSTMMGMGVSNISALSKGIESATIPAEGDWVDEYDMYGGLGIAIDFDKYQAQLKELGLR